MKVPDPTVNDADQPGSYLWAAARHAMDTGDIEEYEAQLASTPWPPPPEPEPDPLAPGPGQLDMFGDAA